MRVLWLLLSLGWTLGCMPATGSTGRSPTDGSEPRSTVGEGDGQTPSSPRSTGRTPADSREDGPSAPDADADGLPDDEEARFGTDVQNEDTDGDGVTDGVEVVAGTDPTESSSTIAPTDFYVVLPYEGEPQVRELSFTARLDKGDVFFLVDTTGSMTLAIENARETLMSVIVPGIAEAVADVRMGVGDFRDFPVGPYGDFGDWSFQVRQPMTSDVSDVQASLDTLRANGGGDTPESASEGLFQAVAGRASCDDGAFGSACFRDDGHPIVVVVTDAPIHNGPDRRFDYDSRVDARTWSETLGALDDRDVKIIGAAVQDHHPLISGNLARPDLEELARETDSRGLDGNLTVFPAPGGQVSDVVVDGVAELVGAETQDVTSRLHDDPSDDVDATELIREVRPLEATRSTRSDETTFYGVGGGTTVTFEVTFQNDSVPHGPRVRILEAEIELVDLPGEDRLDRRQVYIVIPAEGGSLTLI